MRREDIGMLLKLRGQRGAVGHDQKVQSRVPEGAVLGCKQDAATAWGSDALIAALLYEAGHTGVTSPQLFI